MKMILQILLFILAVTALIYLSFYFAKSLLAPTADKVQVGSVCFRSKCFQVEIASTEKERSQGLMNRENLDRDKGMLFIFDKEGIHPFWMKNTLIPLDIIWINSENKVVFISQNVQPCKSLVCPSIIPPRPAKYVLEVNAGICKDINLTVGDVLEIKT